MVVLFFSVVMLVFHCSWLNFVVGQLFFLQAYGWPAILDGHDCIGIAKSFGPETMIW